MNRIVTTAFGTLGALGVMTLGGAGTGTTASVSTEGTDCAADATTSRVVHRAVYEKVEHPAVTRTVPAITHQEWQWERPTQVTQRRFERTVTETLVDWQRDAGVVESVEYEWVRTVDGVTETDWSQTQPPGDGWTKTGEERGLAITGTEVIRLPEGVDPPGKGWFKTGTTAAGKKRTESTWATVAPGSEWTATGATRVVHTGIERTSAHSADAPGSGWTKVVGSEVTVVDTPETTVTVSEARTEKRLVTPRRVVQVPAASTDAC